MCFNFLAKLTWRLRSFEDIADRCNCDAADNFVNLEFDDGMTTLPNSTFDVCSAPDRKRVASGRKS